MAIKNVALIGGTGTVGAPILSALKTSPFNISVLNRQSSKSTYPDTNIITIPDDLNVPELTKALKTAAIDALIIAIAGSHVAESKLLIEAALNAGVSRVIPPDFGSCDSADPKTNEILPLMAGKKVVRDYLVSLEGRGLSWTSLITAHFFDWGLSGLLLNFDVKARKAFVLDGGDIKFSASNLEFIARAVVKILQKPEETKNKLLYVHSHHVTQNEVLASLEQATGSTFEVVKQSSEEELKVTRPKMLEGDHDAYEAVVAVWGIVASDWKGKENLANGLLGLEEEESLDETVQRVVKDLGA